MIYSATLNLPVKRAFPKQAMQSTLSRIIDNLTLDPEVTNMDVVILGPKDCGAAKVDKLAHALENRHVDVCVIYIYTKDSEKDLIDCEYKFATKKITEKAITQAYQKFVGDHQIRIGKGQVTSGDFKTLNEDEDEEDFTPGVATGGAKASMPTAFDYEDEEFGDVVQPLENKAPVPPVKKAPAPANAAPAPAGYNMDFGTEGARSGSQFSDDDFTSDGQRNGPLDNDVFKGTGISDNTPTSDTSGMSLDDFEKNFMTQNRPMDTGAVETPVSPPAQKIEDAISGVKSYEDWAILRESLRRDSIMSQLIIESSEFNGLQNFLDVLDRRIETVWRDNTLSAEMKFDRIKEIGLEKSMARAAANSISTNKVIGIVSKVILSAKRTVEDKIDSVNASIGKIVLDKTAILDTQYIDKAINERMKIQGELLNISREIVEIYKSANGLLKGEIAELDRNLPSANPCINDWVKPVGTQIFTPSNTAILANKLMQALQENKILASQMEESINALIATLFELCSKDEEIFRYQANMIDMLKANRVEELVVVDSALKRALNLWVGADNTGRSATAITWSGVLSRRKNILLIDITGRPKFKNYGITPMDLDEFMVTRAEQSLLCVQSTHKLDPEEVQKLLAELRARLNYYSHINVIVAPEDTAVLNQMSEEALSVNYITDCSTTSTQVMFDVIKAHTCSNVARKLVVIDTPVSPLMIADSVGIDPTQAKLISLPNMPAIRACALRYDRPYEFTDVVKAFEEAFRT